VDEVLQRAYTLFERFEEVVRDETPEGSVLVDVHTHLGTDIDGMVGDYDELERIQARAGIVRALVFCLDEPDRIPAFRAANDRTLAHARRSGGRLVALARLDLSERPIEEATRCLDLGAGGIKLHPRAQKFLLDDERLAPVFELASERKVPILIHGGRGLPPIADALARLMDRFEGTLIVAHAGIADLAALAHHFSGRPGVFFDTSVWSALDLLDLFRLVSPEQVLYASDYPYGHQPASLLVALRTARLSGLDDDQVRAMLGGTASLVIEGRRPERLSSPKGVTEVSQPVTFARIHQYLSMATPLLWTRQADTVGVLGLALNACDERSNGHREQTERIRELLLAARDLWRLLPETEGDDSTRVARTAFRLLHLANVITVASHA
jgi:predicted TIM-barrel fold metal-dependent hydrolase